jgi:hypothetical protein
MMIAAPRCHLLPFCRHSVALRGQARGQKLPIRCGYAARMLPKSCHLLPFVAISAGTGAAANTLIHMKNSHFLAPDPGKHGFSGRTANRKSFAANRSRHRPATNSMVGAAPSAVIAI